MDEMTRMAASIDQITKRVDDFSFRLAAVENDRKSLEAKIDSLRELFDLKLGGVQQSVEGWNKIGFWLLTTVGGVLIVAVLGVILTRPL